MRWQKWMVELPKLASFAVRRCVKPDDFGEIESAQLHHFSDASNYAYGTVTYPRLVSRTDNVHCTLLAGKSRVAPVKPITIPRAELTAATVSVRMNKLMTTELEIPIHDTVYWTDSMTVLKYIANETTRFHIYVANRVNLIREGLEPSQWRYVDTKNNQGDDASRGPSADGLLESKRWIDGPEFLWKPETEWPKSPEFRKGDDEDDPEVKKEVTVNAVQTNPVQDATNRLITYFSDWLALKKIVAWFMQLRTILLELAIDRKEIRRVLNQVDCDPVEKQEVEKKQMAGVRVRSRTDHMPLTIQELQQAEIGIMRFVQRQSFREEIDALEKHRRVKKSSSLFKADHIILRVDGRLSCAIMPVEAKHPAILLKSARAFRKELCTFTFQTKVLDHPSQCTVRSVINKCFIC